METGTALQPGVARASAGGLRNPRKHDRRESDSGVRHHTWTGSCEFRAMKTRFPCYNERMQLKRLGNSDMDLTPIGIGAWAMGGSGWAFAWGPQDDDDSIAAIHAALDRGINWIDTAAVYGLGHSEEVVARALKGRSRRPYVFTKCERVWNERRQIQKSLKRDSIRGECEASLRRLKVDTIDLYQIHWPEPDEDIEEGWETLAQLKKEGK